MASDAGNTRIMTSEELAAAGGAETLLFECAGVKHVYLPVRADATYSNTVRAADRYLIGEVVKIAIGLSRQQRPRSALYDDTPRDDDGGAGMDDQDAANAPDVVQWMVASEPSERHYTVHFLYPRTVRLDFTSLAQIMALGPEHFDPKHLTLTVEATTRRLALSVRVLKEPYKRFTNVEIYRFESPPVFTVPREALGEREEGRAVKRSRRDGLD